MTKKTQPIAPTISPASARWREDLSQWRYEWQAWRLHGLLRLYRTCQVQTRRAFEFDRTRYAHGQLTVLQAVAALGGWDEALLGESPNLECEGGPGVELRKAAGAGKLLATSLMLNGVVQAARGIRENVLQFAEDHGPAAARSVITGAGGGDRALMGDDPLSPSLAATQASN